MPLASMTGFGRAEGALGDLTWRVELRSVNGRGLDIRTRLSSGAEALEADVRQAVRGRLKRGSVSIAIQLSRDKDLAGVGLNETALNGVLAALDRTAAILGQPAPGRERLEPLRLLALRGVLDSGEGGETLTDQERAAVVAGANLALDGLVADRAAEGARLTEIVAAQVGAIEELVEEAERSPARSADAIKARLTENVARLAEIEGFDAARLHQEAVLLATKADIREEIDRLKAHVAAARDLLASDQPAGRRLDFLAQEFNREANTLCSKSNDVDVTRIGMELKVMIDQLREQVQNIE